MIEIENIIAKRNKTGLSQTSTYMFALIAAVSMNITMTLQKELRKLITMTFQNTNLKKLHA